MVPTMALVAADSKDPGRREALEELADSAARRGEAPVVPAFGTARQVNEIIAPISGPVVAVPAFLAGGDAASAEVYAGLDLTDRFDAFATDPLGATPTVVANLVGRLGEAGWREGDGVVLAADSAADSAERRQVTAAARMLSRRVRTPVQIGYLNAWAPSVSDAVARLRRNGQERVAVATWRLVPDADLERLREMEATSVAAPLWPAPFVVDNLLCRHRLATARLAA